MSVTVLHRIDPSRNLRRYYRLDVQPDLFGHWVLVREWGRIGRSGQAKELAFDTLAEAQLALDCQRRAKVKRGYIKPTPG